MVASGEERDDDPAVVADWAAMQANQSADWLGSGGDRDGEMRDAYRKKWRKRDYDGRPLVRCWSQGNFDRRDAHRT